MSSVFPFLGKYLPIKFNLRIFKYLLSPPSASILKGRRLADSTTLSVNSCIRLFFTRGTPFRQYIDLNYFHVMIRTVFLQMFLINAIYLDMFHVVTFVNDTKRAPRIRNAPSAHTHSKTLDTAHTESKKGPID